MPPKEKKTKKPGDPKVVKKPANPGLEAMKRQLAKVKAFMSRKRAKEQKEAEEKEYLGTYLPKAKGRRQMRLIKQRSKINELLIETNDEIIFLRAFISNPNREELLTNVVKSWSVIDNNLPAELRRVHYYRRDFILTLANLKPSEQLDFAKVYMSSVDDVENPVRPFIPRRALDKYIFGLQRQVGRNVTNYVLRIDPSLFQEISPRVWNVRFPTAEKLATVGVYDFSNLVIAANKLLPPDNQINRFILNKTQQAAKLIQYFGGQEHRVSDFEPYLPSRPPVNPPSGPSEEKKLDAPPVSTIPSRPPAVPGQLLRPSDVAGGARGALPQLNQSDTARILAIGGPQALQQYNTRRAIYENRFQMKKARTAYERAQARKTQILLDVAEEFKVAPSQLAFEIENPTDLEHFQNVILPDLGAQGMSDNELFNYYTTQTSLIDARKRYTERISDRSDRGDYYTLEHGVEDEDIEAKESEAIEFEEAVERGDEDEKEEVEVMEEVREANEGPEEAEEAGDYSDAEEEKERPSGLRGLGRGEILRPRPDIANLDDVEALSEAKEDAASEDAVLFGGVEEAKVLDTTQATVQASDNPNLSIKGRGFLIEAGDVAEDVRTTEFQGIIVPETLLTYSAAQDWLARHPEYTIDIINTWKTRPWMKEENPLTKYSETVIRAPVAIFRQAYQKTGLDKYLERKGWGHPSELFWILFTTKDPSVVKGFESTGYHRGRFFIEANYTRVNNNQEVRALLGNPQGYVYERRRFHFDIGLIVQPKHISGQIKRQRYRGTGWIGRKRKAETNPNDIEVFPKGKIVDGFHYTYISGDQPVGWHPPGEMLKKILSSGDYPYTLEGETLTIEVPEAEGMVKYLFDVRYRHAKKAKTSRTDAMCQFAWMRRPWDQDMFSETVIETDNPKFIRSQYVQPGPLLPGSDQKVYVPSSTFWNLRCGRGVKREEDGYLSIRDPVTLTRSRVRIGLVERGTGKVIWESKGSYDRGISWILEHMNPVADAKALAGTRQDIRQFMENRLSDFVRQYGDGPVEIYTNGDIKTVAPGRQKGFRMVEEKKVEYPYLVIGEGKERHEVNMPMVPTMEANIIRYTMVKTLTQSGVPEKTAIEFEDIINRENLRIGDYLRRIVLVTELLKPPLQYYARTLKGQIKNISGQGLANMDPFPELKTLDEVVDREREAQLQENRRLGRQVPEDEKISSFKIQFENYINYLTERTASTLQRWKKGTGKAPFAPKAEIDIYEIDKASLEQKVTLLRKLMTRYMADRLASIGSSVDPEQFEKEVYRRVGVTNLDEYVFRILVYMEPTRTPLSSGAYLTALKVKIPETLDPYMNDQLVFFRYQKNKALRPKKVETGLSASRLYRFTKQIIRMIEDWTTESENELTAKFSVIIQGGVKDEEDDDADMKQAPIGPRRPIADAPMRLVRGAQREHLDEVIESLNDLTIEDNNINDLFSSLMVSLDRWNI
jgi:hypothetical protein